MTNITLEHLAPYLPYGLKVEIKHLNHFNKKTVGILNPIVLVDWKRGNFDLKPILLPLSDIDLKFFQDNIDNDIEDFRINCEPDKGHFSVEVCEKVLGWSAIAYEEYQLFFKHHFDVFGLIAAGLAVDMNTLEGGKR